MTNAWPFPGSRWWKVDIHTHTPASRDYLQPGITAQDWLQAAMAAELDCVAVTDHNSGAWIDALKTEYDRLQKTQPLPGWFRPLTIFPGVEITVADSADRVHLLAILGPETTTAQITALLGACGISADFGDHERVATGKGFLETVAIIQQTYKGIAIPAHIDGQKGLLYGRETLSHELANSLGKVYAAEFCDLHRFDNAVPPLKNAVNRLARLGGSDAHACSQLGCHATWLKMSAPPTLDGLKLALKDHDYCLRNQTENPNHLPESFLTGLTIRDMRYCGRGASLQFRLHPGLTAVIGGRGTGKSTLLEALRIVLRREQELESQAPDLKRKLDEFKDATSGVMTASTELLLDIRRRGQSLRLRWRADGTGPVLEEAAGADAWREMPSGDLGQRFPVSIFSQKQIYALSANPRGLLQIIDRAPEVDRAEWQRRWNQTENRFLQLREDRRVLLRRLSVEDNLRAQLQDVERDLSHYEQQGHGRILKNYQLRSQQQNALPDDYNYDTLVHFLQKALAYAGLSDFPEHLFPEQDDVTAEIRDIHRRSAEALQVVGAELQQLIARVGQLQAARGQAIAASRWQQAVQADAAAYQQLVAEYGQKQSSFSISLYGEWVQQKNRLQQLLAEMGSVRAEVGDIEADIAGIIEQFKSLRAELAAKRTAFLGRYLQDNPYVRMTLLQYADIAAVEDTYRELLELEPDKFTSSVLDPDDSRSLLHALSAWRSGAGGGQADLPALIAAVKADTLAVASGEMPGNHGAFANRLKKLLASRPAAFDRLDAWWPEDLLQVSYAKTPGKGDFADLATGSVGQKAAAILAFLLSYGAEPLIIDQPEDDLDNALIYDLIVRQIRLNKNRRQLIIVTHNANIVVNGDAELIQVLKFAGGQIHIDQSGGLEEPAIRQAVCDIMEGGREAFEKRYQRINIQT